MEGLGPRSRSLKARNPGGGVSIYELKRKLKKDELILNKLKDEYQNFPKI